MATEPPISELIDSLNADIFQLAAPRSHRASIQFHWFQNAFFQPFGLM